MLVALNISAAFHAILCWRFRLALERALPAINTQHLSPLPTNINKRIEKLQVPCWYATVLDQNLTRGARNQYKKDRFPKKPNDVFPHILFVYRERDSGALCFA